MVVFELPSEPAGAGPRAVSLGSCRVHGPLAALADRGDLRLCAMRRLFSFTASEALQTLEMIVGGRVLPDALNPYLYGPKQPLAPEPFRLAMAGGADVFIVEVSHDRQFSYGDVFLQSTFLSSHFVRPYGRALLPWFRQVSSGRGVDEVDVRAAAEALRQGGFACGESTIDLLRGVRFEHQSGEAIESALGAMMSMVGGRWIVVGPVVLAESDGAIMRDRRALNAKLERAARRCGATHYDPSRLVAEHGRAAALDAGGADLFEYAPEFRATVGEALIDQVRARRQRRAPRLSPRPSQNALPSGFATRSTLAERVNLELLSLHRERLAQMGSEASGLYDYYEALIERDALVGLRERAVLELVEAYLPSYGEYGVVRAGLGEVALLLAASGRDVVAYEPNANRRAAIEAGRQRMQAAGLLTHGAFSVVASLTPEGALKGSSLGVGLNVAYTPADPGTSAPLERIGRFDALLVDPRFFFRDPDDGMDGTRLAEGLRSAGFNCRRDYPADSLAWFHR